MARTTTKWQEQQQNDKNIVQIGVDGGGRWQNVENTSLIIFFKNYN